MVVRVRVCRGAAKARKVHTPVTHLGFSSVSDQIPLNAERTLRVLGVRDEDADKPPVLVVEDMPGSATSDAA
jgi:hypothetical protein